MKCNLSRFSKFPTVFALLPIFLSNPATTFIWMASFCPVPELFEDEYVHLRENILGNNRGVIITPPSYNRVQQRNKSYLGYIAIAAYNFPCFTKKSFL